MYKQSVSSIAQRHGISRDTVYKIKDEGFFKLSDRESKILNYVQKKPFASINEISKELKLPKNIVHRTLRKFHFVADKQIKDEDLRIIRFLLEREDYKTLNDFLYYNNVEFEPDIVEISNTDFRYLKYLTFYHRMSKGFDILDQLDSFLEELRSMELNLTYLKSLILKTYIFLLKKEFNKIVEIIESIKELDSLISLSLKAKFYIIYVNSLSRLDEIKKIPTIIRKLNQIYPHLNVEQKRELRDFISGSYHNLGDLIKAYKFSQENTISQVYILHGLGKHKKVVNYKFDFEDPQLDYLYTYVASVSYILLNNPQFAIEKMISVYDNKNIKFEDYLEKYYMFQIIYHKYFNNSIYLEYFEELKSKLGDKIDRIFYATVSGDISNLKNTLRDKLVRYYFEGRLNRAVNVSRKYGLKTNLYFLLLFHPKPFSVIKRYKEFSNFLSSSKKSKIKLYLLRKRPFFIHKNRKFYLRSKGRSINIIKLFINSSLGIWHFSKDDIKFIKYKIKLPLVQNQNDIILNAHVYLDFKEVELSYRSGDTQRLKRLFKSLPFGLKYHPDEIIDSIIKLSEKLGNK